MRIYRFVARYFDNTVVYEASYKTVRSHDDIFCRLVVYSAKFERLSVGHSQVGSGVSTFFGAWIDRIFSPLSYLSRRPISLFCLLRVSAPMRRSNQARRTAARAQVHPPGARSGLIRSICTGKTPRRRRRPVAVLRCCQSTLISTGFFMIRRRTTDSRALPILRRASVSSGAFRKPATRAAAGR